MCTYIVTSTVNNVSHSFFVGSQTNTNLIPKSRPLTSHYTLEYSYVCTYISILQVCLLMIRFMCKSVGILYVHIYTMIFLEKMLMIETISYSV